jgi:UDP-glucose 4-epimerase
MLEHVVVTGASGFIGNRLVQKLVSLDLDVVAISRSPLLLDGCQCIEADICDEGAIEDVLTPHSTVFHLASHASVAGSVKDPKRDFQVNVQGVLNVLESARKQKAAVVFTSSSAVFDPSLPLPHDELALQRPSSPYGASKIAAEAYLIAYNKCYNLDTRIARIFNVYGPGMTRFAIWDFYQKLKMNQHSLEILGNGDQIRDYLYIDDCIDGLIRIAERGKPGESYNLASGNPVTTLTLAQQVAKTMGLANVQILTLGQSFPGDVAQWYANIDKIKSLDFKPRTPLSQGLRKTIDWFESQTILPFSETEKTQTTPSLTAPSNLQA